MNKIKTVGFLQNPWSPLYAGGTWPRESWIRAFWASRSGTRLKLMLHDGIDWHFDNATPIVCENPRDIIPPDIEHIRKVITEQKPDIIVSFGTHSANGVMEILDEFNLPLLWLPHPTYRVVTNELFTTATEHILKGFKGIIRYMPSKEGGLLITKIPKQSSNLFV
jgi:hypothetical protein